jgi:hypothetical protein
MRSIAVVAAVALVAVAGISGYVAGIGAERSSTSTLTSISTTTVTAATPSLTNTSTTSGPTVILPAGLTFQVQSSWDCSASYFAVPFNVTAAGATLQGWINATNPGVSIYLATAQRARSTVNGHPDLYMYGCLPSNPGCSSTSNRLWFSFPPGQQSSFVLWIEGADMGCGASAVTPLEQMTNVTVSQAVTVIPGPPAAGDVGMTPG